VGKKKSLLEQNHNLWECNNLVKRNTERKEKKRRNSVFYSENSSLGKRRGLSSKGRNHRKKEIGPCEPRSGGESLPHGEKGVKKGRRNNGTKPAR